MRAFSFWNIYFFDIVISMSIPTKTLKNWFSIPVLGFGTWGMWGRYSRDKSNDDVRDKDAIRYAIQNGLTAIDTAELYAGGYAETMLGEVMQEFPRESLFISTKVIGANASYTAIKNACKNSLKRLQTPYIDLYYIHWRDSQFDLQEQMKAMNELVDEGLIKHIWVCNFSTESLKLAQSFSKYPIVANQVHYNLMYREPEKDWLLEYCQQNDVMLIAWRPTEKWVLSGVPFLSDMREKYKKTDAQIAINWLTEQKNVVTLFKSSSHEHIDENLRSIGWDIDVEDRENISKNFPEQKYISNAVPLG